MNTVLWIGILLALAWLVGWLLMEVAGFLIHLLLIAAVVLLIWWAVQKFRAGPPGTAP